MKVLLQRMYTIKVPDSKGLKYRYLPLLTVTMNLDKMGDPDPFKRPVTKIIPLGAYNHSFLMEFEEIQPAVKAFLSAMPSTNDVFYRQTFSAESFYDFVIKKDIGYYDYLSLGNLQYRNLEIAKLTAEICGDSFKRIESFESWTREKLSFIMGIGNKSTRILSSDMFYEAVKKVKEKDDVSFSFSNKKAYNTPLWEIFSRVYKSKKLVMEHYVIDIKPNEPDFTKKMFMAAPKAYIKYVIGTSFPTEAMLFRSEEEAFEVALKNVGDIQDGGFEIIKIDKPALVEEERHRARTSYL